MREVSVQRQQPQRIGKAHDPKLVRVGSHHGHGLDELVASVSSETFLVAIIKLPVNLTRPSHDHGHSHLAARSADLRPAITASVSGLW